MLFRNANSMCQLRLELTYFHQTFITREVDLDASGCGTMTLVVARVEVAIDDHQAHRNAIIEPILNVLETEPPICLSYILLGIPS